jgi:group II intron reverse transcriptase/maturase
MAAIVEVRDMRDAQTTLAIIEDRGRRGLILEDVYRRLYNPDLYLRAYGRLYRNRGAMTEGTTSETVDGMSMRKITGIIGLLREERYRWSPVRRVMIPKGNGKLRPLGIPTWGDKLLQEVMRSILEAYFEPQFSDLSHGFRPGRGCHSALRKVFCSWTGTKWFIEGDIKGCFDNIDHTVLVSILRDKIRDGRFLRLAESLLEAGYLERWDYRPTLSGTPQGGIVSPLLANIYLDQLDRFVEQTLIPEYTKGTERRKKPEYQRVLSRVVKLKRAGADEETLRPLRKELRRLGAGDPFDPAYRRLRYIRYADDFLLGFAGPRDEAEEIKGRIGTFLRDRLKLELSPEKTLVTHAATERARFLGYDIGVKRSPEAGSARANIILRMPTQKLEATVAKYMRDGEPIHRKELQVEDDFTIVYKYGSEYQGIVQYYAYAQNRFWLNRLRWVMETSMLKTLAAEHKTTVSKVARRYKAEHYQKGRLLKCFEVTLERPGRKPLVARFGGLRLRPDPFLEIADRLTDIDRLYFGRTELIARLLAGACELCGSTHEVQVHHVPKLADLKVRGRRDKPSWIQVMAARKRKTLVVCAECHHAIHAGRPTRSRVATGATTCE